MASFIRRRLKLGHFEACVKGEKQNESARPHSDDLVGTSDGEQLQLDHPPHLAGNLLLDRVDMLDRRGTDKIGFAWAAVRPSFSPATACSPWKMLGGISSSPTPHRNIRRTRPIIALIFVRRQPFGDRAVIFILRLGRVVSAEIDVAD